MTRSTPRPTVRDRPVPSLSPRPRWDGASRCLNRLRNLLHVIEEGSLSVSLEGLYPGFFLDGIERGATDSQALYQLGHRQEVAHLGSEV